MTRKTIHSESAPAAIGPYSQAVHIGNTVYLSGQTPHDPATGKLVDGDISDQTRRVFANLSAVCEAAGGSLKDIVRMGVFVTDLGNFAAVNAVMRELFSEPYPARTTIGVRSLPVNASVEIDAIMVID